MASFARGFFLSYHFGVWVRVSLVCIFTAIVFGIFGHFVVLD
jgi:hypothetical protein